MKSIKITSTKDLVKTLRYIRENGKGMEEVNNDLVNCVLSLETGEEFKFTSI